MGPDELLSRLEQIEELLRTGVAGHHDRIERLLLTIARNPPNREVPDLAMKALTAASAPKRGGSSAADQLADALSRLRAALLEAKKGA